MVFEGNMRLTIGPNRTKIEWLGEPQSTGSAKVDDHSNAWFAGKLAEFNELLGSIDCPLGLYRQKGNE